MRRNEHHSSYLQRAWNKYGEQNFEFIILQRCDIKDLIEIETNYIKWTQATDENFGYNSCEIGRSALGRKHSPETLDKISKGNKGKKLSQEHIQKMKEAFTGKKRNPKVVAQIAAKQKGSKKIHTQKSAEHKERIRRINIELANRRWGNSNSDCRTLDELFKNLTYIER